MEISELIPPFDAENGSVEIEIFEQPCVYFANDAGEY